MKECSVCLAKETPQWYTNSICKRCYRKNHRKANLEKYSARDASYYSENSNKVKDRQNKYYRDNTEECKARSKAHRKLVGSQRSPGYLEEWHKRNPKKTAQYCRSYAKKHPDRVKRSSKRYIDANLHKFAAREARKRAVRLQATPKWLTEEHFKEMERIYETCPKGQDVDHMIPLISPDVCGLHVPWNLQHLDSKENRIKSNKILPEYTILHDIALHEPKNRRNF